MFRVASRRLHRVIAIGDMASLRHRFTTEEVATYARLVGDSNPIHVDAEAAKRAGFDGCIVHGILVTGLFSNLMGMKIPGPQSVYLSQDVEFVSPVFVDDEVEAEVSVLQFHAKKGLIALQTTVRNVSRGTVAIKGRALGMNKVVSFKGESQWEWHRVPM